MGFPTLIRCHFYIESGPSLVDLEVARWREHHPIKGPQGVCGDVIWIADKTVGRAKIGICCKMFPANIID